MRVGEARLPSPSSYRNKQQSQGVPWHFALYCSLVMFFRHGKSGGRKAIYALSCAIAALLVLVVRSGFGQVPSHSSSIDDLYNSFLHPPDDARIMMRWWWFGAAVEKPELEGELKVMKEGGIGGVEIQPVYPLVLDDPTNGVRNLPYLSDAFLDAVQFTNQTATKLGLRVDMTLCSGWPYGGPYVPVTQAAGKLRVDRVEVANGTGSVPSPNLSAGEALLAAFLVRTASNPETGSGGLSTAKSNRPPSGRNRTHSSNEAFLPEDTQRIDDVRDGRVQLPSNLNGPHQVLFFISSRTGMQVKRPAVGSEGFVLDHYDRSAIDNHLKIVGDRLITAFGSHPPHSVFSDSLEDFGSDWTGDLISEFKKRRGYDLAPYLPALVGDIGEKTGSVRHDWGKTLTELANERYLTPIREWAHAHNTLFRSQTYGVPPVNLSSNALVDLPEGEAGPRWRSFAPTRWASSASHLYRRPVTSSETWTWLHSPAFRATPLDMKAEADLHFLEGINQLVGHGWPYSPAYAGEPGWRFYAAAVFNHHNPWWLVMPDITSYLQRMSFLLRQGQPANDIAVYVPTDDAWAAFTAGNDSIDRSMDRLLGQQLIPQILDSGYTFDFIDDQAIETVGIPHRVVILPGVERIPLTTYQRLQAWAGKGGILVAAKRTPSLAPGLIEAESETPRIRQLSTTMFQSSSSGGHLVENEQNLGRELATLLAPDFKTGIPAVGFIHRKLQSGELYFVANTSNEAVHTQAEVRVTGMHALWWDGFTGKAYRAVQSSKTSGTSVDLALEPYESRVLVLTRTDSLPEIPLPRTGEEQIAADLSSSWTVTFQDLKKTVQMQHLHSWADDPDSEFYSGIANYEKTVSIPAAMLNAKQELSISFGRGSKIDPSPPGSPGMRALLESPIREAALVYVNDQLAGPVWRPPFEIDVTKCLHPGENKLRVQVGNLAINELAGQDLPDYRLLTLKYTRRFDPQDMDNLKPLPSGLLGPVRLIAR